MIYDKIENWKMYFKAPIFNSIFEELKKIDLNTENGVYKFDKFYFKVMEYNTKNTPEIIESHVKEVDIQILLSGNEGIKMYHQSDLSVKVSYDENTDCTFYNVHNKPYSELILKPGFMAVFFPQDPHHPQFIVNDQVDFLKKIVIKVNVELFQ